MKDKEKEFKDLNEKEIDELNKKADELHNLENEEISDIMPYMHVKLPSYTEMIEFCDLIRLRDIYRLIDGLKGEIAHLERKLPMYTSYGRPLPYTVGKAVCIKCGIPATCFYIDNVRPPNYIFYCDEHADEVEDKHGISTKRCYKTDGVSLTKTEILQKIKKIYYDIIEAFNKICLTWDPDDIEAISNEFNDLQDMALYMADFGSEIYEKYTSVIGNVGTCQASLVKLNPKKVGEMWTLNKDDLSKLATSFGALYSSIENLIANLSK